jgi:hypothetical protein
MPHPRRRAAAVSPELSSGRPRRRLAAVALAFTTIATGVAATSPVAAAAAPVPEAAPASCAGRRATIVGTRRSEVLRGTPRADVIWAGGGNDRVAGRGGNDIICGGAGRDRIWGGNGNDRLVGGDGNDWLTGGAGFDRLGAGAGFDRCVNGERRVSCERMPRFATLAVGASLPSGPACARSVRQAREIRPGNRIYNNRRGTSNDRYPRANGRFVGTTDEILQWVACKWGIGENLVRAQAAKESWWQQTAKGDLTWDQSRCHPALRTRSGQCPESIGLLQVRWRAHSEAFERRNAIRSTSYNADYTYAVWRACFEGELGWLNHVERGATYRAGDAEGCLGVWFSGRWRIPRANEYIAAVKDYLRRRIWTTASFRNGGLGNPAGASAPGLLASDPEAAPRAAAARRPTCNGLRATIVGSNRSEVIRGTARADVIVALGGNDTVYGGGGNDTICGGFGRDTLHGGGGNDFINGGVHRDRAYGGAGRSDSCIRAERRTGCERRTSRFVATFDGMPSRARPFNPRTWDVTVHTRNWFDKRNPTGLDPMHAHHGRACQAPPATHHVDTYAEAVFQCNDHVMTSIKAGGYGLIYLTPNRLVDFSAGSSIRWNMSTHETGDGDWVDVWITPPSRHLQLALQDGLPDLAGPPRDAIHIRHNRGKFWLTLYRGGRKFDYKPRSSMTRWDSFLRPDKARRDTFRIRLSPTRISMGMPGYRHTFFNVGFARLGWTRGVVQFGHHSYNPDKHGDGPNTWHWDDVRIADSLPFRMVKGTPRIVTARNNTVRFARPTPRGHLRFSGIDEGMQVSFNGRRFQPARQNPQDFSANTMQSYWTPIPAGTRTVRFRGRNWWGGHWRVQDVGAWSL